MLAKSLLGGTYHGKSDGTASGTGRANRVHPRNLDGQPVEFDNAATAQIWHVGFVEPRGPYGRSVLGFSLASREDVDATFERVTSAGHVGRQPPYDAFWGARYAIVADPDGRRRTYEP